VRELQGGHWDARKSTPMRFLPTHRLADGQHRCRAVVETGIAIVVTVCLIPDTLGVDEGAGRTLVDHLQLSYGLDEDRATLASVVTKTLCHVPNAANRDYLDHFALHRVFITDCVEKPLAWLADKKPNVARVFKPALLASLRAQVIAEKQEAAEAVDQLLCDAVNDGETAPQGSPRRDLAKQISNALYDAFSKKKTKRSSIVDWVLAALMFERQQTVKNILTARVGSKKRSRPRRTTTIAA
jgi:hypothetical protein